jgi:hypothetical protein
LVATAWERRYRQVDRSRLAPEDARALFALVKEKCLENTEIVLNGETPGGDSRVAKTGPRKQQINRAKTRVAAAPFRSQRLVSAPFY